MPHRRSEDEIQDFLIQYELTPEQQKLAGRLKAEANFKQLLRSLGDHALFLSQQVLRARRAQADRNAETEAGTKRAEVLQWLETLSVSERMALLTCDDATRIRTVLKMVQLGGDALEECRFAISLRAPPPLAAQGKGARARNGKDRRQQAGASTALPTVSSSSSSKPPAQGQCGHVIAEPAVHCRKAHKLPDGTRLEPPATPGNSQACARLLKHMRVAFRVSSDSPVGFEWGAILPSPALVQDVAALAALLDEVSLGSFLQTDAHADAASQSQAACSTRSPWTEASWLSQLGPQVSLPAFLASRLEVLLLQGFESRHTRAASDAPPRSMPLADVWASVPVRQRETLLARLGTSLLRRLLTETLSSKQCLPSSQSPDLTDLTVWEPPSAMDELLAKAIALPPRALSQSSALAPRAAASLRPLDFVCAVTTVPLVAAACVSQTASQDLLQVSPVLWLHQNMALELAVQCSDFSASALVHTGEEAQQAMLQRAARRREKKQRQKLRRRQGAGDLAFGVQEEEDKQDQENMDSAGSASEKKVLCSPGAEEPAPEPEHLPSSRSDIPEEIRVPKGSSSIDDGSSRHHTPRLLRAPSAKSVLTEERPFLERAFSDRAVLDDLLDDRRSDRSSIGVSSQTTSLMDGWHPRSSSHHGSHFPGYSFFPSQQHRRTLPPSSFFPSNRRSAGPRWHDDSRLEFLLRSRDRFAAELEWDRMSQGSVPASLDEQALGHRSLETRFAYLFDSPAHSHLPSSLASQATADDDAERLRTEWMDLEEWQSLTQALAKMEGEVQCWKSRAEELEALVATLHSERSAMVSAEPSQPSPKQTPLCDAIADEGVQQSTSSPVVSRSDVASSVADALSPRVLLKMPNKSSTRLRTKSGDVNEIAAVQTLIGDALHVDGQMDGKRRLPRAGRHVENRRFARSWSLPAGQTLGAEVVLGQALVNVVGTGTTSGEDEQVGPDSVFSPESPPDVEERLEVATAKEEEEEGESVPATLVVEQCHMLPSLPPDGEGQVIAGTDGDVSDSPSMARRSRNRKRALHVQFGTPYKRNLRDSSTQTAPAITLSKMYGGMVPRYLQRELARFRQENQFLRYRIASLAMSEPLGRSRPAARDQATQTAPTITFSTARQQGRGASQRDGLILSQGGPRMREEPEMRALRPGWLGVGAGAAAHHRSRILDESLLAYAARHAESEEETQLQEASLRLFVQSRCQHAVQTLWPQSSMQLCEESFSEPEAGLELLIYPRGLQGSDCGAELVRDRDKKLNFSLAPIVEAPYNEDAETAQRAHSPPAAEDAGGGGASTASGVLPELTWQQKQLCLYLEKESWVLQDSLRVSTHGTSTASSSTVSFTALGEESIDNAGPPSCPIRMHLLPSDDGEGAVEALPTSAS